MIATQQIKSTTQSPYKYEDFISINVLNWKNSKWAALSPYYLKTDGNEINKNKGGILFENFWQGSKVYDKVVSNEVYPSKYQHNNPKYLWWKYEAKNKYGDIILDNDGNIDYDIYLNWRKSLWEYKNPIRYPNKIEGRKNCKFALIINKEDKEVRMDYLTFRKEVYVKEYIRLVKLTKEYEDLLLMLKEGKKLMLCEIDVPAIGKKGKYAIQQKESKDDLNISYMTIEYLNELLNDPSEAFGHGLALALSLLTDVNK